MKYPCKKQKKTCSIPECLLELGFELTTLGLAVSDDIPTDTGYYSSIVILPTLRARKKKITHN